MSINLLHLLLARTFLSSAGQKCRLHFAGVQQRPGTVRCPQADYGADGIVKIPITSLFAGVQPTRSH
ncbi:unnamed protein product [Periconia digitata]|uniref:Secreted protein n=1 Tax=Periconia digitata TaxID=1303443 RepID=A0A9W4UQ55_9PLEO|nr:unnamed protein product [Periconia digitata]